VKKYVVRQAVTLIVDDVLPDILSYVEDGLILRRLRGVDERDERPEGKAAVDQLRHVVWGELLADTDVVTDPSSDELDGDPLFLKPSTVAQLAGVGIPYIRRLCRDGTLCAHRERGRWVIEADSAQHWLTHRSR
jgi:hypothetical protein